jgi:hypothetical protein
MSVSVLAVVSAPTVISVAPTETVLLRVSREHCRASKRVTVQITNNDGSQTFSGTVYRRLNGMAFAPSTLADFVAVAAGDSVVADLDTEATEELEIRGTMSGAGGNVTVAAVRRAYTP